ncbi:NAD(P)/FAD-dependent oxidoreductase [Noviherbaspirillum cavernae]|uniref:NAD(P)/FAD-dependent oxidoreductase n=1 Tax=Noviherbaspirillum cavernae TaxID=2320862 RepID=A0A418WW06_9BURK|nr:FAD-dependent oxidoreductase [Noviherbaspirillum cavernae]RJF96838.1 NAD(P)/FAD-dependent oxidoreductase [Noviherbaspirillum cavernae]
MQHVIIGNGPAGVIAAETIRKHAPDDTIVLLGDEPEVPYSRMAIPYLLHGNIGEQGTHLRKRDGHFEQLNIKQIQGRAARVDTTARQVVLEDGTAIAFDKLLIATGSTPSRAPIPGIDSPGVHNCWTLADARAIMQRAKPGARVVQMGAGFIGCIILEALAVRGVQLTVVEMEERMVPRMMGEGAGSMIRRWCETKGITVHTSTRVEAIEQMVDGDTPLRVRLSNGQRIDADLIISATGVKPNIGFLADSGIQCLLGVLVDETMQTSVSGIYAAGDCAEAFDRVSGKTIVSAIQPNAADQAYCAGMNMAGRHAVQNGVTQLNVLDTLGLVSTSFGQWQGVPGGQRAELTDEDGFRYVRLEFAEDVLVGANAIGLTQHVGVLRGLIESRVPLGAWKDALLADPLRLSEAYIASKQRRQAWLGST